VTLKNHEEELKRLLSRYPPWVERILWTSPSRTNLRPYEGLIEEYESILKYIPEKWLQYLEARKLYGLRVMGPPRHGLGGRPRKDALAEEAYKLKSKGMSWAQVAIALNNKHGEKTTTKEGIRRLLASRQKERGTPPDKT
jgi:hypothetical protein